MSVEPKDVALRPALRRRTDRRVLAGVAGGLADWLNVDVTHIRVVLVIAAQLSPTATWGAYALAAAVLPARGRRMPDWDNLVGLSRFGLIVYGGLVFNGSRTLLEGAPEIWVAYDGMQLIGAAVLLTAGYRREGVPAIDARTRVMAAVPVAGIAGVIVLGVVLVPDVSWDRFLPLGALVASATLVTSARSGSWPPFVAPAVVTTALVAGLMAADVRLQGGVGNVSLTPESAGEMPSEIRRAVGDVNVDLTRLGRADGTVSLDAQIGVGDLRVTVPEEADVTIDARVGRGTVDAYFPNVNPEPDSSTFGVAFAGHLPARDWSWGGKHVRPRMTIRLRARVGAGAVEVVEEGATS